MFSSISRSGAAAGACAILLFGAAYASAGDACCTPATADRGAVTSLAGQRLTGVQGIVFVPATPAAAERPYALTGDEAASSDDGTARNFAGPSGRWVEVGQGRVWIPPTP